MKKILLLVFVMLFLVHGVYAELKAGYHFDNTVSDYIGGYNTYSSSNLIFSSGGKINSALNYIDYTNTLNITVNNSFPTRINETGNLTINFWYYKENNPSDSVGLLTMRGASIGEIIFGFFTDNTEIIKFAASKNEVSDSVVQTSGLLNNTWYMVTGSYNGVSKEFKIYINGVLIDSDTFLQTGEKNTADIFLGRVDNSRPHTHRIDELTFYNTALNDVEILSLYNSNDNFSITTTDDYNLSSIYNFSANIDGVYYYSNEITGILETPINSSLGTLHNITLYSNNYFSRQFINYNISSDLSSDLTYYKSRHRIDAYIRPANTTSILNFNITTSGGWTGRTTNGNLTAETDWNSSEIIYIYPDNYQYSNWTTNGTTNDNHTFFLYGKNSFDIRFYDELTRQLINYANITIDFISDIYSSTTWTTNGTVYKDLLMPANYVLRYSANDSGYSQRTYAITLNEGSYNSLDLYLLNNTDVHYLETVATVKSTLNEVLNGAVINVLKYSSSTGTYSVVEKVTTNFEGKATLHLTDNEYYKFLVEYPSGTTVLTTSPTYVTETSITLIVDLGQDSTQPFYDAYSIDVNIVYSNSSQVFTYTFVDNNNVFSSTCFELYKLNSINGSTLVNASCSTSHSGSISLGTIYTNGSTYEAKAYATIRGTNVYLGNLIVDFGKQLLDSSKNGLFLIMLVSLAFTFVGLWSPAVALILMPIPLLFGSITGIIAISSAVIGGVLFGMFILVFMIGRNS